MAKQFQNTKGFLVIQCMATEIKRIENGALGLCDNCCLPTRQGFLPCVLGHRFFCEKCCSKWMARAVNYVEDKEFEKCVFEEFKSRFVDAGLWEEHMSDKLYCPFCGAELEIFQTCARCNTENCIAGFNPIPNKVWQALISGKKSQDELGKISLALTVAEEFIGSLDEHCHPQKILDEIVCITKQYN